MLRGTFVLRRHIWLVLTRAVDTMQANVVTTLSFDNHLRIWLNFAPSKHWIWHNPQMCPFRHCDLNVPLKTCFIWEETFPRKVGWTNKFLCCKFSRLQLNWSEVIVSVLNRNKFGKLKLWFLAAEKVQYLVLSDKLLGEGYKQGARWRKTLEVEDIGQAEGRWRLWTVGSPPVKENQQFYCRI